MGNLGPPARTTIVNRNREDDTTLERRHGSQDDNNESDGSNPYRGSSPPEICLRSRISWKLELGMCEHFTQKGKLDYLLQEMKSIGLSILGISEMRWTETGKLSKYGYTIVYSGNENTHTNGVGFIIKNKIAKSMMGFWPISDRIIMLLQIEAKPFNIAVIQLYAPTQDHSDEEIEEFYEEINKALK